MQCFRKEDIQVPDNRYNGYEQRPRQGAENMNNRAGRTAPQGSGQPRPAQPRPQGTANRPVNAAPRQAAPQRPAGASGQARPAQARPQSTAQSRPRPAQAGAQQRRNSQYAPVRQTASAQNRARTNGPARKAVSQQGYGYSGASKGSFRMAPAARIALFVLGVALLMTISVVIADKIRSAQPQPVIVMNTQDPLYLTQAANQPEATDAPVPTDAPAAPTDAPAAPTDAPAEPTNVPSDPADNQTKPAGSRSVTIRAIGDVIIDQTTLDNCAIVENEEYDFSPLFELVGGVMADADWTMINIEGTLRKHSKYGYMGYPQFFTPHSILEDLKAVGVDMLTMCNNHALDGWYDGLKMSLDYADAAGLAHVGAYRTQEEHDTPEIYDIGGIKVGMVNYTQYTNSMESQCDPEATIYGMRLMRDADYEGDIAALKNAGAEFTIAIMHWGTEYVQEPDDDIEVIAQRLVAAGVDLVIGGHPHVVQPAEYVTTTQADGTQNTALVIYSLGNFYSEHRKSNTDNGVIFEFTLSDNGAGQIEMSEPALIPIYMWQTEGAGAYEFRAVPSGVYLDNPPAGMSDSQYARMKESYNEMVELIGGVVEIKAD